MMVVYHGAYDLTVYDGWALDLFGPAWSLFERATASLFLALVGVSFAVAWDRAQRAGGTRQAIARSVRRAAVVLAAAALVSIATYLVDPATYVRFGILHLIGTGMLLLPLFASLRELTALVGAGLLAVGSLVSQAPAPSPLLLPFGLVPPGFVSVDYFPIIPWFGVVLIGYAIGSFVYVRRRWPGLSAMAVGPPLVTWPGRHALPIYLVHQPLLLVVFALLFGARWPGT